MTVSLMELHQINPFKIKAYQNVIYQIEKADFQIVEASDKTLQALQIKQGMIDKIRLVLRAGTFPELTELQEKTPKGVLQMLQIKGIGAKKVRTLWQELGVETIDALQEAGAHGKIEKLKGFGKKTQETILSEIVFLQEMRGWCRYAEAEPYAEFLLAYLKESQATKSAEITGQMRRNLEVVQEVQFVVGTEDFEAIRTHLHTCQKIRYEPKNSGVFVWRGAFEDNDLAIEIRGVNPEKYGNQLLINSSSLAHLNYRTKTNQTLLQVVHNQNFSSEKSIYESVGLPFILPELREGLFEFEKAEKNQLPTLIEMSDLRGVLHNHSTYSDGANTLEEMAIACRDLGYEYLGITDHSKTAFYANGLSEERIQKQHAEIDQLNKKLAPFRIFKGIESDILPDGNLDYSENILASFDFVIASIHAVLTMDKQKATERILKAIRNPYTTMLGHPTGRLLLKRAGYPLDYEAVFEACIENQVAIEINANPRRLDLDWRLVHQAIQKGVMLSINPDAHHKDQYSFMRFGVLVGRKGGLQKHNTLNCSTLHEITAYFQERKTKRIPNK